MVAGFLALALSALLPAAPGSARAPQVKSVRVQGAELAYVERGRGQPVVLLHGFGHDYRSWSSELEALSKRYRVIAYSRRHNAPNPPREGGADYSDAVAEADLVALLGALGLPRAHLIGHSAGAKLALLTARDHPQLVRSLVLAEPLVESMLADNAEAKALPAFPLEETGRLVREGDVEGAARVIADAIIGRKGAYDSMPVERRQVILDNLPREMKAAASAPPGSKAAFRCGDARRIEAPTLFVQGENTLRIFQISVEEFRKCMPGSELEILPRATHALELENPAGFDEIVLKFLARH